MRMKVGGVGVAGVMAQSPWKILCCGPERFVSSCFIRGDIYLVTNRLASVLWFKKRFFFIVTQVDHHRTSLDQDASMTSWATFSLTSLISLEWICQCLLTCLCLHHHHHTNLRWAWGTSTVTRCNLCRATWIVVEVLAPREGGGVRDFWNFVSISLWCSLFQLILTCYWFIHGICQKNSLSLKIIFHFFCFSFNDFCLFSSFIE